MKKGLAWALMLGLMAFLVSACQGGGGGGGGEGWLPVSLARSVDQQFGPSMLLASPPSGSHEGDSLKGVTNPAVVTRAVQALASELMGLGGPPVLGPPGIEKPLASGLVTAAVAPAAEEDLCRKDSDEDGTPDLWEDRDLDPTGICRELNNDPGSQIWDPTISCTSRGDGFQVKFTDCIRERNLPVALLDAATVEQKVTTYTTPDGTWVPTTTTSSFITWTGSWSTSTWTGTWNSWYSPSTTCFPTSTWWTTWNCWTGSFHVTVAGTYPTCSTSKYMSPSDWTSYSTSTLTTSTWTTCWGTWTSTYSSWLTPTHVWYPTWTVTTWITSIWSSSLTTVVNSGPFLLCTDSTMAGTITSPTTTRTDSTACGEAGVDNPGLRTVQCQSVSVMDMVKILTQSDLRDLFLNGTITVKPDSPTPSEQVLHTRYNRLTQVWMPAGSSPGADLGQAMDHNPFLQLTGQAMQYQVLDENGALRDGTSPGEAPDGMVINKLRMKLDLDGILEPLWPTLNLFSNGGNDFEDGEFLFGHGNGVVSLKGNDGQLGIQLLEMLGDGLSGDLVLRVLFSFYDRNNELGDASGPDDLEHVDNNVGASCGDPISNTSCKVVVDINFNQGTYTFVSVDGAACPALGEPAAGGARWTDIPFTR